MSTGAVRDEQARRLAQREFATPLVVEAGAGTGKTALLVARVVAWSLGPGWERHSSPDSEPAATASRVLERVVAITFTEAAAAEMAERVAHALADLAKGAAPVGLDAGVAEDADSARERAMALADEVHRLRVQTIHSFCQGLLQANPIEAGVHPMFRVDADGSLVEAAVMDEVRSALREMEESERSPEWEVLAAEGVVLPRIAEALLTLVRSGAEAGELRRDPFAEGAVSAARQRIMAAVDRLDHAGGAALCAVRSGNAATTVLAARRLAGVLVNEGAGPVGLEKLVEAAAEVESSHRNKLADWGKEKFSKGEREALGAARVEVSDAAADVHAEVKGLDGLRRRQLGAARTLLADLLERVRRRLRYRGVVTYDDLLHGALRLLRTSPGTLRQVRGAMDQLLVDEFQDTDRVQCDIVATLALEQGYGDSPGLFIVGDPKQSIYGWRGADLAAYDAFKRMVEERGGSVLPLVRNFRSVAAVLAEVERVVAPVMEAEEGVQPRFTPLEATGERISDPGFREGEWRPVEHWVQWPKDPGSGVPAPPERTADATRQEARTLAADIRRLHDEAGVEWGSVAVLLRTTSEQEPVLQALREHGVPFEVAREREYYRQREVVEAAALVRCVLEPTDQLALLTVLRSDAVGLPDAALVPLWDAGFPGRTADLRRPEPDRLLKIFLGIDRVAEAGSGKLPGTASLPRWPLALKAAVESIARLRESVDADPPDRFVELLRTLWLTEVSAAGRYLGRFRRARLERFYDQLERALSADGSSLVSVARFLRRAVAEGRQPEVTAEPDLGADAVHVLTVHGAKGLGFEHVYVVQTHRGERGHGVAEVELHGGPTGAEYRLFGWATLGWEAAQRRARLRGRAERVRLLYVAATRAKRRLVISGAWTGPGKKVRPGRARSFGDLLARHGDGEGLRAQAAEGRAAADENGGDVRWVLPSLLPDRPGGTATNAEDRSWPTTVEEVRLDGQRLAEARGEAAMRMVRPFSAPASAEAHRRLERDDADEVDPGRQATGGGEAATRMGSAVHRLLETLELDGDLSEQVRQRSEELLGTVTGDLPDGDIAATRRRLSGLLERLAAGACLARLQSIAGLVRARELLVLLPPSGDDGPLGFVAGAVDLVYTDPGDDRLVVADYKTDRVAGDEAMNRRVEVYRPQLEAYARALVEALGLDDPPHRELWFLDPDRIIRLE